MNNTTTNQVLSVCQAANITTSPKGTHATCVHCGACIFPHNATGVQGAIQYHLANPRTRVLKNGKVWVA